MVEERRRTWSPVKVILRETDLVRRGFMEVPNEGVKEVLRWVYSERVTVERTGGGC